MIGLYEAHAYVKLLLETITRKNGKLFFPQAAQIAYAPSLEKALNENPEQATNKIGFFVKESSPQEHFLKTFDLQCLLTFPMSNGDTDYINSLAFSDEFVEQIAEYKIDNAGIAETSFEWWYRSFHEAFIVRSGEYTPLPFGNILAVRINFSILNVS